MLTFLIVGCASAPESVGEIPGWFSNPPSENDEYVYFTVSEKVVNIIDAEQKVGEKLFTEILDYIGISKDDSQLQDLDEYRRDLISLVTGNEIPGFKLIEKQINDMESESIIYILVELEKKQLTVIEDDLLEILTAGLTASIISNEAEEFVKNGDLYSGAVSYLKAALESADSDNKFITGKNLDTAIELIKQISIAKINSPATIAVGENGVFSAQFKLIDENITPLWNNVSVKVTFRDRKKGSVISDRFASLRADANGQVTFVHPSPGFTGSGRVDVSLDLLRDIESLEKLEENYSEKLVKLRSDVEAVKVSFDFEIISSAPFVPTGILIIDSDFLRKPLDSTYTAEGLEDNLVEAGFIISVLDVDRDGLLNLTEKEFLRDIPYMVDSEINRVIYGIARITEFDDSAAGFTVVTEAEIKVVDIDTGEIIFNEIISKRVQGGESQTTINTSFKELGKSFSSLLIDKLP